MAEARVIDFNRLPRAVRERLITCIAGQASPTPVLADRGSKAGAVGWAFLALLAGAVLLGVASSGYARPYDSASVQGPVALLAYAGAIFAIGYSVLAILRTQRLHAVLPFIPGRYLFPMDFVDARERTLRIVPMNSLVDFSAVHHHTNGVYTHTLFTLMFESAKAETFTVNTKAAAESALLALKSSRAAISEAVQARNIDALASLDPFFEIRVADAWENPPPDKGFDPGRLAGEMPPWLAKASLVALGPALVLGPIVWYARNRLSDEAMFSRAIQINTEEGFEDYLVHGRRHADEVRQDLLWKAAFDEATKAGTSQRLASFVKKYPEAPVTKETSTQTIPRLALKEAVTAGTVSAVREFLKNYPGSVVDAEARTEVHKLFTATLTAFQGQASKADPKMLPFVGRLLKYLEDKESPPVQVSFRGTRAASLALADKLLQNQKKEPSALDIPSLPGLAPSLAAVSPHFSDDRSQPREDAIVTILQGAFATIFPADVLPLKKGASRTDPTKAAVATDDPRIDIDYEIGWSGSTYTSSSSGREFVGIKVDFDVAMRIPGEPDKEALRFKLNVAPPEHFTVNYMTSGSPFINQKILNNEGPTDEKVYEVMAARAFDELSNKLRGVFFKEGSTAFKNTEAKKPASRGDSDDEESP